MVQENEDFDVNRADLYRPGTGLMFTGPGDPNKEVFAEKIVKELVGRWKRLRESYRRRNG